MKRGCLGLALALTVAGCSSQAGGVIPDQTKPQREAQIHLAADAVKAGNFEYAERLLGPYMYRSQEGELLFKSLGVSSEVEKKAVDTVALMLWDTGRDASLEKFAGRYLSGYEREVMLCRLAERGAIYERAYACWNDLGDVDRARRVTRTESALRILKD
jgi:hypothetical protein